MSTEICIFVKGKYRAVICATIREIKRLAYKEYENDVYYGVCIIGELLHDPESPGIQIPGRHRPIGTRAYTDEWYRQLIPCLLGVVGWMRYCKRAVEFEHDVLLLNSVRERREGFIDYKLEFVGSYRSRSIPGEFGKFPSPDDLFRLTKDDGQVEY